MISSNHNAQSAGCLLFFLAKIWECKSQNKSCDYLNDDNSTDPGSCIHINDCLEADTRASVQGILPQWCNDSSIIICCPLPEVLPHREISNRTSAQSIFYH